MIMLSYCVGNIISYLTMIFCGDLFRISDAERSRKRFFISAGFFILLLPITYYVGYTDIISGNLEALVFIPLFAVQFLGSLSILFGRMSLKLLYLVVVVELITEHISACITAIMSATRAAFVADIIARLLLLLLIFFFFRKTDRVRNAAAIQLIPRHIYILFLLVLIFMSGLITLNAYPVTPDKVSLKMNAANVLIIILTALTAILLLSLLFNVIAKQQSENTAKLLSEQVESQIRHYDRLEQLDNEMRRFRHDYTNHLQSILSLIQIGEYAEAEDYIANLQKQKQAFKNIFYTGNKLADAILSDKAFSLPERIHIEFQGMIPPGIENTDLCVILSNSLDNAAEACLQRKGFSVIYVSAYSKGGYLVLTISNPTSNKSEFTDIPQTTKEDKQNHGIGLSNIRETVNKYDGQMKINCSGGVFELTLLMKLKNQR